MVDSLAMGVDFEVVASVLQEHLDFVVATSDLYCPLFSMAVAFLVLVHRAEVEQVLGVLAYLAEPLLVGASALGVDSISVKKAYLPLTYENPISMEIVNSACFLFLFFCIFYCHDYLF